MRPSRQAAEGGPRWAHRRRRCPLRTPLTQHTAGVWEDGAAEEEEEEKRRSEGTRATNSSSSDRYYLPLMSRRAVCTHFRFLETTMWAPWPQREGQRRAPPLTPRATAHRRPHRAVCPLGKRHRTPVLAGAPHLRPHTAVVQWRDRPPKSLLRRQRRRGPLLRPRPLSLFFCRCAARQRRTLRRAGRSCLALCSGSTRWGSKGGGPTTPRRRVGFCGPLPPHRRRAAAAKRKRRHPQQPPPHHRTPLAPATWPSV